MTDFTLSINIKSQSDVSALRQVDEMLSRMEQSLRDMNQRFQSAGRGSAQAEQDLNKLSNTAAELDQNFQKVSQGSGRAEQSLNTLGGAAGELQQDISNIGQGVEQAGQSLSDLGNELQNAGEGSLQAAHGFSSLGEQGRNLNDWFLQASLAADNWGKNATALTQKQNELHQAVLNGRMSAEQAKEAYTEFASSLNETAGAAKNAEQATSQAEKSTARSGKAATDSVMSWGKIAAQLYVARAAFDTVRRGAEMAWQTLREGAELQWLEFRFENLARAIGTSSDELLDSMSRTTRGLLSQAEAMGMAADLIGLKLVDTVDEASRLSGVVAGLGMDLNQLTLTLTNQTTMRFDQLGVAVGGFEEKLQRLEAQGLSTDKAFLWAFIEQAEESMQRAGSRADTLAGKLDILEAAWGDSFAGVKSGLAEVVEPLIDWLASSIIEANNAADAIRDLKAAIDELSPAEVEEARHRTSQAIQQAVRNAPTFLGAPVGLGTQEQVIEYAELLTAGTRSVEEQRAILLRYGFTVDDIGFKIRDLGASWVTLNTRLRDSRIQERVHDTRQWAQFNREAADSVEDLSRRRRGFNEEELQRHQQAQLRRTEAADIEAHVAANREKARIAAAEAAEAERALAEEALAAARQLAEARAGIVAGAIATQNDLISTWHDAREQMLAHPDDDRAQQQFEQTNQAIADSYAQMMFDVITATDGWDRVAADWAVASGMMSQAEADMRFAVQNIGGVVGELGTLVDDGKITPEQAAGLMAPIVEAVTSGSTDIATLLSDARRQIEAFISGDWFSQLEAEEGFITPIERKTIAMLQGTETRLGGIDESMRGLTSAAGEGVTVAQSLYQEMEAAVGPWEMDLEHGRIGTAVSEAQSLYDEMWALTSRNWTVNVSVHQTGGVTIPHDVERGPARAYGGPVYPGIAYPVGERGTEWFMPQTAGTIVPGDRMGMGGDTINHYTISLVIDGRESALPATAGDAEPFLVAARRLGVPV